jgi:hypothetical protein
MSTFRTAITLAETWKCVFTENYSGAYMCVYVYVIDNVSSF